MSRSSITEPSVGERDESPSSRPTASEEVITELAPDCLINGAFSCSRTADTIQASGLSWRTVRVASTLESSRSVVMMTCSAWATRACRSTLRRVASPTTTARPSLFASSMATWDVSTISTCSRSWPLLMSVSTALRPFVP